jgi:predicted ester cyclase
MSESNKAVYRRWIEEGINKKHVDLVDECVAEGYVFHGPGNVTANGPAGLRELVTGYLTAFPDLHITIDDLVAEGEKVVLKVTARGTHKGPLGDIAPTGRSVTITSINFTRFEGGKMIEDWQEFDELGMMRQIGAVPPA